eukprot:gene49588-63182_t
MGEEMEERGSDDYGHLHWGDRSIYTGAVWDPGPAPGAHPADRSTSPPSI